MGSILLMMGLLAAVASARAAPLPPDPPVGTVTLEFTVPSRDRKVASELWFEAAPASATEELTVRPPLRAITLARNAQPAVSTRKRALVVISHGNWGTRFSQGWLALSLVRAGYVVLSTSHPGTLGDDQTAAGRLRLWDRARDVSLALDELLRHPRWAGLIDESRIGFVGHSFGGWTGVSLAGGRYDTKRQRAFCASARTKDVYCEASLKDEIAGVDTSDGGDSFKDERIKAFYIMASGPAPGFTEDSLLRIAAPFVVDTAKLDEVLEADANSGRLARLIPGAIEVVRPVGHFAYVPECKPYIGALLARAAGTPICDDPRGVDRAAVHVEVAERVLRHFKLHLAVNLASGSSKLKGPD